MDDQTPVQSPFIARTQIQWAWDSTCLGDFKKCPRYYYYKRIEGWTREGAIHLRWGGEFHTAVEEYEHARAEGYRHDDAVHFSLRGLFERIEEWDPDPRSKSEELKTKANLIRTVVWYFDQYADDSAKTMVLANGKPAVEVSFQFELDYGPQNDVANYTLCGHLDKVVHFNDDLFVLDHKTTTTTPASTYFEKYDTDNQMTLYTLAGQIVLNAPIKGVIVDAIQVAVGFSRFTRGITYRTQDQLDEWLDHTKEWLAYAERCASEGFWPMNDTSCDKYGGCEFRGVCGRSPNVRQRWLEAEFRKEEPWNPLKPR